MFCWINKENKEKEVRQEPQEILATNRNSVKVARILLLGLKRGLISNEVLNRQIERIKEIE